MALEQSYKILFMAGRYGAGHQQAANAVKAAVSELCPAVETMVIDPEEESRKVFGMLGQKLFINLVKKFPSIYDYFYRHTRYNNYFSSFLKEINQIGRHHLLNKIYDFRPSVIVCTDPVSSGMVSSLKKQRLIDIPLITVVTDYAVHSFWVNPSVNSYIVGSESVRKGLMHLGVDNHRITVTGIPIHPKFSKDFNRESLRKKYGLKNELPTILIAGGGFGLVGKHLTIKDMIKSFSFPVQVVLVCGHNKRLYHQMEKELKAYEHVHLKGYVDNMEELMAISDCMITKAGGLSISEALSMEIPMILYHSLGGHEQENMHYLLSHGAALLADHKKELYEHVAKIMTDRGFRRALIDNMRNISCSNAAFDAANVVLAELTAQIEFHPALIYQLS